MDKWDLPANWSNLETDLYAELVALNPAAAEDPMLQLHYHVAYWDWEPMSGSTLGEFRIELAARFDEYGIDFWDQFDWEEWAAWYEEGANA